MNKKLYTKILIIVLGTVILILSIKYNHLLKEYNWKESNAEAMIKSNLIIASEVFSNESSILSPQNIYEYNTAMNMITASSQLITFTSYNENITSLYPTLDNLANLMRNYENEEKILTYSKEINENLLKLSIDIENIDARKSLNLIIDNITKE